MPEYWIGENLLGLDGDVLEIFIGVQPSARHHIYHLSQFQLRSRSLGVVARSTSHVIRIAGPEEEAVARGLIDAVNRARAARGWGPVPVA